MLATEAYKRVPRDCCQIIDRLHLGSVQASEQPEPLKELGVTHILCAAARIPAQYPKVGVQIHKRFDASNDF